MFYAPWCGHCKQLAPALKKVGKALDGSGVRIGAVDVEPNPSVQAKFPDIRGFPTLKFLPTGNAKKAVDYQGGRDEASISDFLKQQATKLGIVGAEPVAPKTHKELYTFFGRAALDKRPPLLLIGADAEPPSWLGKLATELRKEDPAGGAADGAGKEKPEAKTKELLREASRATKVEAVKEGIAGLLETLANAEAKPKLGPAAVAPAYSSDPEAAAAFGFGPADLPALVVAAVDRKTAGGSYVVYPGGPVTSAGGKKGGKVKLEPLAAFVRSVLPACNEGPAALEAFALLDGAAAAAAAARPLPAFPKPPNVVAAEERERKRKARDEGIAAVASGTALQEHCYGLASKTCALLALPGGAAAADEELAALARKFSKDGFGFAAVDSATAPAAVLDALFAGAAAFPALSVVKGGKRPRAAVASGGAAELAAHLDSVAGGGASFAKLKGGLPEWPAGDEAAGDEISEGEL